MTVYHRFAPCFEHLVVYGIADETLLRMMHSNCNTVRCVTMQDPAARMLVSTAAILAELRLPASLDDEASARQAVLLQGLNKHLSRRAAVLATQHTRALHWSRYHYELC